MANNYVYPAFALTGGADNALDAIDGAGLLEGDRALVMLSDGMRLYRLDATSGAAEESPRVIVPDTNAGTKRWILVRFDIGQAKQDAFQQVLEASKYESMTFDVFADDILIDNVNSTGIYSQGDSTYRMSPGQILQTLNLFDTESGLSALNECMLLLDSNGSPAVQVTADGGVHWETITPMQIHTFANPGTDLRLKLTAGSVVDMIVDNVDAGFSTIGTWYTSNNSPGYYGSNYVYSNITSNSATWTFTVPEAGTYELFAQWAVYTNHTTTAQYTLTQGATTYNAPVVSQRANGGQFNSLGTVNLQAGTATVTLTFSDGYASADAVRLTKVSGLNADIISYAVLYNPDDTLVVEPDAFVKFDDLQGFRNKIINGNFDIWQRGISLTGQTSIAYLADRWSLQNNVTSSDLSRQSFTLGQTDVPGNPKYFIRNIVTSAPGAANGSSLVQFIEGVRTLAGKAVTLSFWAKADSTKNIAIDISQEFGTGGTPSDRVVAYTGQVTLTSSWQKFVVNTTLPSISGKTLGTNDNDRVRVKFWFDAGADYNQFTNSLGQQSGTFDLARVQFEEGIVATPFQYRHIQHELALCQRYYQVIFFRCIGRINSTSGWFGNMYPLPVVLRATPAVTWGPHSIGPAPGTLKAAVYGGNSVALYVDDATGLTVGEAAYGQATLYLDAEI